MDRHVKKKYVYRFFLMGVMASSALYAGPDASYQAQVTQYCKERASCSDEKQQIASDLNMMAACSDYYQSHHCDEVKDSLGKAHSDQIMSCNISSFCESDDPNVIQCTIEGIKTQFTVPGLAMLMGSVAGSVAGGLTLSSTALPVLPFVMYEAGKSAEACHKDMKFKKMAVKIHNLNLLEDEKPLEIEGKDKALLDLQCAELNSFLKKRLDVVVNRRTEKQSWSLDDKTKKLSPMAKALLENLQSTRCFKPAKIRENLCHFAAAFVAGGGIGFGAAKGITRTLATSASKSLTNAERISWAELELSSAGKLKQPLTDAQKKAIIDAHNVGKGQMGKDGTPAGPHNWTDKQIEEKRKIILASGLTLPQWGVLRKTGVTGYDGFPTVKGSFADRRRDLIGMPEPQKIIVYESERLNERLIKQGWDTQGVYANGYEVHLFTKRGRAQMSIIEPSGELYGNVFRSSTYKANASTPVKLKGFYTHSVDNAEIKVVNDKISSTTVDIKLFEHEVRLPGKMPEQKTLTTVQTKVPGELKYHEIFEERGAIVYRAVFRKPNGDLVKRTQHIDPKTGELSTAEKDTVIVDKGQFKARPSFNDI